MIQHFYFEQLEIYYQWCFLTFHIPITIKHSENITTPKNEEKRQHSPKEKDGRELISPPKKKVGQHHSKEEGKNISTAHEEEGKAAPPKVGLRASSFGQVLLSPSPLPPSGVVLLSCLLSSGAAFILLFLKGGAAFLPLPFRVVVLLHPSVRVLLVSPPWVVMHSSPLLFG